MIVLYSDPASKYAGLGGMDGKVAALLDVDGVDGMAPLYSAVFGKEWEGGVTVRSQPGFYRRVYIQVPAMELDEIFHCNLRLLNLVLCPTNCSAGIRYGEKEAASRSPYY